jgi:3D (Asp-Asp-Asp) domain-containing protein
VARRQLLRREVRRRAGRRALIRAALFLALLLAPGVAPAAQPERITLDVTATAYNSTHAQTDASPHHGAWGDDLDAAVAPGVRVIAVSQDLLARGLRRGQRVRIHGLKGEFVVLDKMPRRWTRRIDIYMQKDVRAARAWGRRRVKLSWLPEP